MSNSSEPETPDFIKKIQNFVGYITLLIIVGNVIYWVVKKMFPN